MNKSSTVTGTRKIVRGKPLREGTDPNLKQDFLELEASWLFLARSLKSNERQGGSSDVDRRKNYEFVQSLESFVLDVHRGKIEGE